MEKKEVLSVYEKMEYQLLPNLGFTNIVNFRSNVCNTDNIGLRFNEKKENFSSVFDENKINKKEEVLITGGSTAMGMAASSDQKTLSSILSKSSRFHVYNFGVRAYNGFQELILTQSLINKFNKLKKIFIMSGINDLYFFLDSNFTKRFPGPQAYGHELYSVKKEHLTFYQRLKFNFKDNKKLQISETMDLKNIIQRNLKLWSIFSKSQNIELVYFLQPFLTWGEDKTENQNKNKMDYGKTSIMNKMDGSYKFLKELLEEACLQNNIEFVDLNNLELNKEDIFLDRVHLNDTGFEELAKTFKTYL
jgi:hypothetical protein